MKRSLLVSAATLAFTSGAFAADLPARTAPPVYAPPPVPVFTWTGGYFGVNAGYAFDNDARFTLLPGNTGISSALGRGRPTGANVDRDGFTGGGQIGYNYQFGGLGSGTGFGLGGVVVGIEADAAYTDLTRTETVTGVNPVNGVTRAQTSFRASTDFLGTVRGRLGFSFGQALVYATGGLAYGDVYNAVTFINGNGTQRFIGSKDDINTGYTVGGGIEYALPTGSFLNFFKSSAVTVKVEYLYYDLGSRNLTLNSVQGVPGNPAAGVFYAAKVHNDGNLVRAGLNYKF